MLKPFLTAAVLLVACTVACTSPPQATGPLLLRREPAAGGTRLLLVAEPGARISAEYSPTLTLKDGTIVRLDTTALSPDSAYFAEPPAAMLRRPPDAVHGLLKASVCRRNEAVCRLVKLEV